MSNNPNTATLRAFYSARQDSESALDFLHRDVEWIVPGHSLISGSYRGRTAVANYMARRQELVNGSFAIQVDSIIADDDVGLVIATGTAERANRGKFTWQAAGIFEFLDGLIVRCVLVPLDDPEAFDEFWS